MREIELLKSLRPKLTDEFLETLTQAVRTHGWGGDFAETAEFVRWCYGVAGKESPELLSPYEQGE